MSDVKLDGLVLHIGPLQIGVKTSLHYNDMSKSEIDKFLQCVLDLQTENKNLRERNEKLKAERDSLLGLIYNHAIGEIAMDVTVDANALAQSAYNITGINAEQLRKDLEK